MIRFPFILAGCTLLLGTAAAYAPLPVIGLTLGLLGTYALWRWPLWGIGGLILATLCGEFARITIGGLPILPLDLLTPLVVSLWFIQKCIRRESFKIPPGGLFLMGFWLIAAASLLFGATTLTQGEFFKALLYLVRFIAGSSLLFVCYNLNAKESRQLQLTMLITFLLLALSGFVILYLIPDFTAAGLAELGWDPHIGRLTTAWLDPNFAGGAFALGLALVGSSILAERNAWQRLLLGGLGGVLLIALLLTYSRSGLLAFAIAGLILGVLRSRTALLVGTLIAIIGIAASTRLQERLGEFATSIASIGTVTMQTMDPTAALRVASWQEALRIWESAPLLGVGFGAYAAHQSFAASSSHAATGADSSLLTLGATTGIIGVMLFLGFLIHVFWALWRKRQAPLACGLLAGGAGLLIHAVFVNSLLFPPLTIYFFVLAGLATRQDPHTT